jgi:hypothetical protein
MGLFTCYYINNLNLSMCLRIVFYFFIFLIFFNFLAILNLTKAQFHGLSLVPIQNKVYLFFEYVMCL